MLDAHFEPDVPAAARPGLGSAAREAEGRTGTRLLRIPSQTAAGPPQGRGRGWGRGQSPGGPWPPAALSERRLRRRSQESVAAPLRRRGVGSVGLQAAQCTSGIRGGLWPGSCRPPGGAVHAGSWSLAAQTCGHLTARVSRGLRTRTRAALPGRGGRWSGPARSW